MERLTRRLELASRALASLEQLSCLNAPTSIERDAAIQRFEYTVEAGWKAARAVLAEHYGIELASPKPVVRACAQNGLLSETDARSAMEMIDDRNLTSHTYNEELAVAIFARLAGHANLLRRWLAALGASTV